MYLGRDEVVVSNKIMNQTIIFKPEMKTTKCDGLVQNRLYFYLLGMSL